MEVIFTKNFSELKEDIHSQAEEARQVPNGIKTNYFRVNCRIPKIKSNQNDKKKKKIDCKRTITDCKPFISKSGGHQIILSKYEGK